MRFLIGSLFIFALLMWGLWMTQREELEVARGPVVASSPSTAPGDLRIDLWVDTSRVTKGHPVKFTLTLQNPTVEPIANLEVVRFSHDGFSIDAKDVCWKDDKPACASGGKALPDALAPGESTRIEGSLIGSDPGRSSLGALIAWKGKTASRAKSIASAPITIQREYSAFGRATRNFFKDLGWPLALALLGYLFKKAEDAQTRLRETWSVMFDLSHQRAEKYWMPLAMTLDWLVRFHASTPRDHDRCFFYLLQLWRQMHDISLKIGGFFLKAHVTEDLLASCWSVILFWSMQVFGNDREKALLELSTPSIRYSEYQSTYGLLPFFRQLRNQYAAQSEDVLDLISSLAHIMDVVLEYEMNRPYEHWYQDGATPFEQDTFNKAVAKFDSARAHFKQNSMAGLSQNAMKAIRDAMDQAAKEIERYRAFIKKDTRRIKLGKLFAV